MSQYESFGTISQFVRVILTLYKGHANRLCIVSILSDVSEEMGSLTKELLVQEWQDNFRN